MYANKLQAETHEVILAADGETALEKIKDKYNLIVLDVMMPKIGGVEVLRTLKSGVNAETIVLVLTNLLSEDVKKQCLEAGAKEFLVKADFSPSALVDKIREYLK
jgi:DNA-binding response OmpR family regulator